MITDLAGRITYLNPVAAHLTGWGAQEAIGELLEAVLPLVSESTRRAIPSTAARCLAEGRSVDLEDGVVLVRRDGTEVPVGDSAAPVRDQQGATVGVVLVIQDESEKRRVGHRLAYEATHDALTGLVNRREFDRRLARVFAGLGSSDAAHALLIMDLDRFKTVNDSSGHQAGDAMLRELGPLLSRHLRKRDTLARMGGDEFGALLENCPLADAERVAESLRAAVEQYRFEWEGQVHAIGISVGLIPVVAESGGMLDVLRAADGACYEAKEAGGNRVHLDRLGHLPEIRPPALARRVTRLARAADEGHFRLFAQPILPIRTDLPGRPTPSRYEILLRLPDGHGGMQVAADFLPQAERHHLMPAIDRWVVRETIALLGRWQREHPDVELPVCSINLSASALAGDTLLPVLEQQLARHQVPARHLCFELNEAAVAGNLARAAQFVAGVQATGCEVALDQYGGEPGSIDFLRSLPVDWVKIAAPLVSGRSPDPVGSSMVAEISRLGRSLGIRTVATQVDREETLPHLHALGLGYAQGLALAPPTSLTDSSGRLVMGSTLPGT